MMRKRVRADNANERGRRLADEGRWDDAIREYEKAIKLTPEWSVPHYNIGLAYKYTGRWDRSLRANQRAVELHGDDEASWWNLGIAATALGDWAEARRAWRAVGMEVPAGDGPVDYPSGSAPIRLHPRGDAEVVWSQRLDPARAVIRSIPFPESGFRFSDLVLNDGAAVGYRMLGDQEVPVFDCLGLLEASPFSTFVAEVAVLGETACDEILVEMALARGLAAEDWSKNVRTLCKACSEGRLHNQHDQAMGRVDGLHRVGVAAHDEGEAERLLSEWRERVPSIQVRSIELALD